MPLSPTANRRVIVTGATSGIGAAVTQQLARGGAMVLATGRRQCRLDELTRDLQSSRGKVIGLCGDITSATHRQRLLRTAQQQFGGLDILINNAGVGAIGPFMEADTQRLRQIMEVNFFAPVELTREAYEMLRMGSHPAIVNISSVLAHRAVPSKSEYCASKFALHGFSDALRAELAQDGIDVLLVSPSTTSSEFFHHLLEDRGTAVASRKGMTPEQVAVAVLRSLTTRRHESLLSWGGRMLVWLDRLAPTLANFLVERYGQPHSKPR